MTGSPARSERLEEFVLEMVERAALEGKRCPTRFDIAREVVSSRVVPYMAGSSVPSVFKRLSLKGLISVSVYARNYRVVTILKGPNAGKTTLPPPFEGKPHTIIDGAATTRRYKSQMDD
jgi:hypothetical protein